MQRAPIVMTSLSPRSTHWSAKRIRRDDDSASSRAHAHRDTD